MDRTEALGLRDEPVALYRVFRAGTEDPPVDGEPVGWVCGDPEEWPEDALVVTAAEMPQDADDPLWDAANGCPRARNEEEYAERLEAERSAERQEAAVQQATEGIAEAAQELGVDPKALVKKMARIAHAAPEPRGNL